MRIEEYTPADLEEMTAIWNEVVKEGFAFPQDTLLTENSARDFYAAQSYCGVIRDPATRQLLGLYILHPNNIGRCDHIANASYAVANAARGKGIGTLLVKDSLKIAKKLGFRIVQFNAVVSDNEAANRLYQTLGFQKLGVIPGGFRRDDGHFQDINLYFYEL